MSYLSERAISSMIYLFLKSSDTYNVYIENELDLFFEAVYRICIEESKNLEAKKELDLFKKVFKNELIEGDYSVNDENKMTLLNIYQDLQVLSSRTCLIYTMKLLIISMI